MSGAVPSFDEGSNVITLPEVNGIVYTVNGQPVEGTLEIKKPTTVRVNAAQGLVLDKSVQKHHTFKPAKKEQPVAEGDDSKKSSETTKSTEGDKPKNGDPVQTDDGGRPEAPQQSFGRTRP